MFQENHHELESNVLQDLGPPSNSIIVSLVGRDRLKELATPSDYLLDRPSSLQRKKSSRYSGDELADKSNARQISSRSLTGSVGGRSDRSLDSKEFVISSKPPGFLNNPLSLVSGGEIEDSPRHASKLRLFKKKVKQRGPMSPQDRREALQKGDQSSHKSISPKPTSPGLLMSPLRVDRPFLLAKERSASRRHKAHFEEKEIVNNLFRKGDKILDRVIHEKNLQQNRLERRLAQIHHSVYEAGHWSSLGWIKRKPLGPDFHKYFSTKSANETPNAQMPQESTFVTQVPSKQTLTKPNWAISFSRERLSKSQEHPNPKHLSSQQSSSHQLQIPDRRPHEEGHNQSNQTAASRTPQHQEYRVVSRLSHSSDILPVQHVTEEPTVSIALVGKQPQFKKKKRVLRNEELEKLGEKQIQKEQALLRLVMARKLVYNPRTLQRVIPIPDDH